MPQNKRCNGITDCPNSVDELNCCKIFFLITIQYDNIAFRLEISIYQIFYSTVTLADGDTLTLDADFRPISNRKGIVAFHRLGNWWPLCGTNWTHSGSEIAAEVCLYSGFSDYEYYTQVTIANRPLKTVLEFDVRDGATESKHNDIKSAKCKVLYVKCSNTTAVREYEDNSKAGAPWDVAIYVEGEYKCIGTLLEDNWILTSSDCFRGIEE